MSSLVTVIVPAYNCAGYVAETLDSVLAQDHVEKEVIVVNDGSNDSTLEVLRGYGDRIHVINQQNAGVAAARNTGLGAAKGKYIAFVDADDIWLKTKLSAQTAHLDANPDVAANYTNWHVWRPDSNGCFSRPEDVSTRAVNSELDVNGSGWLYIPLLLDCVMQTSGVMVRATVAQRLGNFDSTLSSGEDYDYWLRLSREGRITKFASVGVLYRALPNSLSRTVHTKNFEHQVVLRALGLWGPIAPDGTRADPLLLEQRLERLQLDHAFAHLHHGNPRIALTVYRNVAARHPTEIKHWLNTARAAMKALRKPKVPIGAG